MNTTEKREKLNQDPLFDACEDGNVAQVTTLLSQGADPNYHKIRDFNKDLYIACETGNVANVKALLSQGAHLNYHENKFKRTPLHVSAELGHEDVTKLLLEQPSVNVDSCDRDEWTPLHWSVVKNHPAVAKLLLDAGANLSSVDEDGDSPLHSAAYNGHLDTVKLLFHQGADLLLRNKYSETALHVAKRRNVHKVVQFLEEVEFSQKWQELQAEYVPLMANTIERLKKDDLTQSEQYIKLNHLYGLLNGKNRRISCSTLEEYEHVLVKMFKPPTTDTQRHIATSVRMMREKGSLKLRTLHLILHGLPAAGKTCAKLRLTGQEFTSRKPAERRDGMLIYPLDDGARSTPVAEEITRTRLSASATALTRTRLPASAAALTRKADNQPWYLLQSLDEEIVGLVEKITKLSSKTKKVKKQITAVTSIPSNSQAISLPAEPVGKAFQEMITSAFNNAPHNILQDILKETLIYLIDSGGQPQFQELLPILVSGPSVFLLTFSLAVPLDAVYEVHFTDKDGKREDYPTNMRVRDVLVQSLASIRCTCSYQTNGEERVEVKPRVIFMATMRSLVSDEEIAAVDKQLKSLVEPFSDLIVYNGSKVLFPVDSFTGEGISALRGAVRCTADDVITKVTGGVSYTSPMCEVKLPTTAVALELLLRNQEKGIISLDQCKRLAINCNIDPETELPHVLWLLHHFTGSIRYYPEDTTLRQYVVTCPQRLYDIPSTLLTHTFAFKKEGEPDYVPKKKVWTRGVFTMETLRKLWGQDQELTPELIVTFLIHLNIIVHMHDEESGEESFFMPSALVCAPDNYFIDAKVSVDSTLVCFNGGYSPKGVFSSVIAYLPKKKKENEPVDLPKEREENEPVALKWYLPSTVGSLCCNQATLVVSVNEEFDLLVKLTLHLKFIEIAINSECEEDPVSPAQLQLGCEAVLHDVSRAVQVVSQSLHYNNNATLKDGLFFPCYCSNDPCAHAVEYLPLRKKGKCHSRSSQPDQLWMHKWTKGTSSEVKQSQPSIVPRPSQDKGGSNMAELKGASGNMARESHTTAAAAAAATELSIAVSGNLSRTLSSPLTVNLLLEAVSNVTDWHVLGRRLGLTMSQLRSIEITYHVHGVERIKAEIFDVWIMNSPSASWTDLITALRGMGKHKVASNIAARHTQVLQPVPSTNPDKVAHKSCWQQIRDHLVQFTNLLCTSRAAWAVVIVILAAAVCVLFYKY